MGRLMFWSTPMTIFAHVEKGELIMPNEEKSCDLDYKVYYDK